MTETRLGARLATWLPDDDVPLGASLAGSGVASAALFGAWVATQVPGLWGPALVALSIAIVPGIMGAILSSGTAAGT